MFTVDLSNLGHSYKISIGSGRRGGFQAKDIDEVKQALEHFYRRPWHEQFHDNCPLCRN